MTTSCSTIEFRVVVKNIHKTLFYCTTYDNKKVGVGARVLAKRNTQPAATNSLELTELFEGEKKKQ
jgi:hypothetical protein